MVWQCTVIAGWLTWTSKTIVLAVYFLIHFWYTFELQNIYTQHIWFTTCTVLFLFLFIDLQVKANTFSHVLQFYMFQMNKNPFMFTVRVLATNSQTAIAASAAALRNSADSISCLWVVYTEIRVVFVFVSTFVT